MKGKRVRSNRVCFTLNNPSEVEKAGFVTVLGDLFSKGSLQYSIIGLETAPTTGTPHLQGFIALKTSFLKAVNGTPTKWKSLVPSLARAHLENAYGSDQDSKTYCSKETVFLTLGTPSDKDSSRDPFSVVIQAQSMEEVQEINPELAVKYRFQLKDILQSNFYAQYSSMPRCPLTKLMPWQTKVCQSLMSQNQRAITWVVDERGARGKTTLRQYLQYTLGDRCFYTTGGKNSDVVHSFVTRQRAFEYVIFDYPRKTEPQFYNWALFEDFKNGDVNSGKYNSICLQFPSIKILVLGNHSLDSVRNHLTYDRWDVHILSDSTSLVPTDDPPPELIRQDDSSKDINFSSQEINAVLSDFDLDLFDQ